MCILVVHFTVPLVHSDVTHKVSRILQKKWVFKDLCRCNTKTRIDGQGPANPSCGMTPTLQYNL